METPVPANLLAAAADSAAAKVTDAAISTLRELRSILAGEDSGLGTAWLVFCAQVQGEHSIDWDDFEDYVRQVIEGSLLPLSVVEQKALWLRTLPGNEWIDEADGISSQVPMVLEDVVDDLYGRVCRIAADFEDERLTRFLTGGGDGLEYVEETTNEGVDEDQDA